MNRTIFAHDGIILVGVFNVLYASKSYHRGDER